jgi:hypothetical protein
MLGAKKRKLSVFAAIAFVIVISSSFVSIVYSVEFQLEQGQVLLYKYARISTSDQGQQTGEALYQILAFNQQTLAFQINSAGLYNYSISYANGFPVSVDRLEALIYLPPESISQSLQGKLDWLDSVQLQADERVVNRTGAAVNYTVDAGAFNCLNLTLAVAGAWDSVTLTLLYDLNSGLLVFEQWIPTAGDIIVQFLASTEYVQGPQQNMFVVAASFILPAATLATPVWLVVLQTRRRLKKPKLGQESKETSTVSAIKSGFPQKALVIAMVGASLSLIAVFLPWSQTQNSPTYLPFSLIPVVTQSSWLLPSNLTFTLISLAIYAAAILSWLSIALHLYKPRKLTPQATSLASGVITLASAATFAVSGWTHSWGLWMAIAGASVTLASLAAANVHVSIEMEPEEPQKEAGESGEEEPKPTV